jgi:hypothetical protein
MRASVEIREWNLSTTVPSFPGVYGGLIIPALKGEVNKPRLISNETQLLEEFTPNKTVGVGFDSSYYSASSFLTKSNKLWVTRAANNPLYGGCLLGQDPEYFSAGIFSNHGNNTFTLKHTLAEDLKVAESILSFISTGEKIMLSSDGTLPTPLGVPNVYYYMEYDSANFQFQLAYTKKDAENGIPIDITDNGSGSISLNLVGSSANESLSTGVADPNSFILDSSDGKISGLTSDFTVDVERDAFDIGQLLYNMLATGDQIQLTADTFPIADTGDALATGITYYVIKVQGHRELQLARTLSDAQDGTFIPISTTGANIVGTLTNKSNSDPLIAADHSTNSFTTTVEFFNASETGDLVKFDSSDSPKSFPIITDGGYDIDDNNAFYVIKNVSTIQVARTVEDAESGIAVEFGSNGNLLSLILPNKEHTSQMTADLSNDTLSVSPTFYEWIENKNKVRVRSDSGLPGGLTPSVDYYVIKLDIENTISLAMSPEAVDLGEKIDISSPGTGTHTIENFSNFELIGVERKSLLFYGANPGAWNKDIYITTIHYPYGDSSNWSQDDKDAVDLIKEEGCFLVYIYKKNEDNSITLVEDPHLCSRIKGKKDGYGNNVYVEDALLKSSYIRAIDNDAVDESVYPRNQVDILMLNGGDDGGQVTDTHMLQALETLSNTRDLSVTLLLDGGWATPAYQKQGLISLASTRKDCFSILSCPIASEQSADYLNSLLTYRKEQLNVSSSYGALFTTHLLIQDKFNDRQIYVPPDGYVGAAISETAANYEIWYPPAGPRRGVLQVLDVVRRFTEGEMDVLYDNGINPIDFYPGRGIRIWGQKTLQSRPSADDRINVRLMLIVIEPSIAQFLEDFLFELNDPLTRTLAESGIESYMENIKSRRGVYDYKVVCSEENNTAVDIDANRMNVWLFVKPTKAAEFIKFTTIITSTGGTFALS